MFWGDYSEKRGAMLSYVTIFYGVHGYIGACFVELNRVDVLDVVEDSAGGVSRAWMLLFVVSSKTFIMIISHLLVVDLKVPKRS
jgi:hypothetical protein